MKLMKIGVLLCVFLVLVSCTPTKTERADEDYRHGTQGLTLKFLDNLPPTRLYDEDKLNVAIEIFNKGAYTVGNVGNKVYLSGFDPSIIAHISIQGKQIPLLEGKSSFNPRGNFDYLNFEGVLRDLSDKNIDKYPFRLFATACYDYKTIASANVCIDPDPFSPASKNKICIPQNIGLGSQGAPIAVNKVDVEASPGRTRFKIHVSNVGGGDVFKDGVNYLSKCSPYDPQGLGFDEVDYVKFKRIEVSGVNIIGSCKPLNNNNLRLTNGRGFIICEFQNSRVSAAYVTPLVIEMDYGYRNSISKSMNILSSG